MRKNKPLGIFVSLFFLVENLFAGLTLEETVERAWSQAPLLSPQLKGQGELYRLSSDDVWRRFVPNEPQFQYANNDSGSSEVFALDESFSFPFKAIAYSKWDKARRGARLAELQAKKYEIARLTVEAYLNAAVSSELVEQQKRNIADTETVARSLQARYESGIATQAETIVTELQLRQQKADLEMMDVKRIIANSHLRKLLAMKDSDSLELVLPDDLDDRIVAEVGDHTADEVRAEAAKTVADANRSVSTWAQMPDFNVGIAKNR